MMVDRSRSLFLKKKGFLFEPFRFPEQSIPLSNTRLRPDMELIAFERGGMHRAFLAREMAYHHVAQGELAGEPYLVSF
ncbi:MAG: DUF3179 domain-containing protein [Anaerolineae bacterium]|nr:DUF3179 domain-containing protein [Anaerolineae bacterium]